MSNKRNKFLIVLFLFGSILLLQDCIHDTISKTSQGGSGYIFTIAGLHGQAGYTGDGGEAAAAKLGFVTGIALDAFGNIYLTDAAAAVIRKISITTGNISTVAGVYVGINAVDPSPDFGEGKVASAVHIGYANGIAVGPSGTIYFCDGANNAVRKINPNTNIVTSLVGYPSHAQGYSGDGGPSTDARVFNPYDVAVDKNENIYIADSENNAVRKITAATGIITTIAGLGPGHAGYSGDGGPATAAMLNNPSGVAVDAGGNVYIADASNNAIRKIDAVSGNITTIAGSGPANAGLAGDYGPATSAKLNHPNRVALDAIGNVIICDAVNSAIREVIVSTGAIYTLAGNGTTGFSGDGGPASMAMLFSPQGIAVDTAGNIFISDTDNNVIRIINH
jgi:sugar lactone lactonase YvrE